MSDLPLKDRDLTPLSQAPAPNWSQASNRCYLCSAETGLVCELCAKAVCHLHAIPRMESGRVMCSTCDENELKEQIRAEMQEELVTLGRDLETSKERLEEVERQGEALDQESAQLRAETGQIIAAEKALELEFLAKIQAEETALQQLLQDLSTFQSCEQALQAEDQKLTSGCLEAEEDLSKVTAERHNLQVRRKEMAGSLERVNKQLLDSFPASQLESIACDQCKRRLAASYQAREPSR